MTEPRETQSERLSFRATARNAEKLIATMTGTMMVVQGRGISD